MTSAPQGFAGGGGMRVLPPPPYSSVLDVACGEGAGSRTSRRCVPSAKYLGLDPSDYAVRASARRATSQGVVRRLSSMRLRGPYDLVVCSDALHYITMTTSAPACRVVRVAGGVLFLEVLTADDDIIGDLHGMIRRPAAWYRKLFEKAGLTAAGPYTWLAPSLRDDAAALEAFACKRCIVNESNKGGQPCALHSRSSSSSSPHRSPRNRSPSARRSSIAAARPPSRPAGPSRT